MKEFIVYLLHSGTCLIIFIAIYYLFLRSASFLIFNRTYLLIGMVSSFIIPFFPYTYDVTMPIAHNMLSANQHSTITFESGISIWNILLITYAIGLSLQIVSQVIVYIQLYVLIQKSDKVYECGHTILYSDKVKSPFTAFGYIFMNTRIPDTERRLILEHEKRHIAQLHWLDLLAGECMLLLQWFNPFAWLYMSLLKENHEFLADRAVIHSGVSPALYQAVLINQRFQGPVFSFSSSFNKHNKLNRLTMIKKEKSSLWRRLAVLAILPAFGIYLWASATPNYKEQNKGGENTVSSIEKKKSTTAVGDNKFLLIVDNIEQPAEILQTIDPELIEKIEVWKAEEAIAKFGEKGKDGVIVVTLKK